MQVIELQKLKRIWEQNEAYRKEANKDGNFLRELRRVRNPL